MRKGEAQAQKGHLGMEHIQIGSRYIKAVGASFRRYAEGVWACAGGSAAEPRDQRGAPDGVASADGRLIGALQHGLDVFI